MVHQGLVLELTLEISGVTNAVPGLYADKGSLLAIRTPEGTDGCLVVYRYCWFTIGIQQHGTVCLTIVDFYAVISEKVIRNLHDAHIGIQRHLHHVMTAVGIALQHVHGLLIIQLDDTFQFTTGHIEGRMTTNLEVNLLAVSILYMPYHMNTVPLQAVSNSEVKTIRINLQRLLRLMESQRDLLCRLADNGKHGVASESVTGQVILLAIDPVGLVVYATYDGEQYRRVASPFWSCLPHIFPTLMVLHTLELSSQLSDANGQLFILQFYHIFAY